MGASRALTGLIGQRPEWPRHPEGTIPQRPADATGTTRIGHRRFGVGARPVLGLLAVLLAVVMVTATPGFAPAQSDRDGTPFVARGVPIEATAASAAQAREAAIAEGQVKAFRVMLERITDPTDHGRLPQPAANQIRAMVDTYSLADERTTDTTYKAAITVRYDSDAVRRLLQGQGIGHASGAAQPVLVLPVYQSTAQTPPQLWEDTNPWLMAWRRQDAGNVLMPLEVPTGDLADVTTVSPAEALEPDSAALERLLERYDRSQVLVAHAIRTGPDTLAVALNYGSPRAMAQGGQRTVSKTQGESDEAFLIRVATEMAGRMEGDWRSATMVQTGAARTATALVRLAGFDDWMRIRKALERSPLIREVVIQAMTRSQVQLRLTALGDAARVADALRAEGLSLTQQGGYWIIGRAGSQPGDGYGSQGFGTGTGVGTGTGYGSGSPSGMNPGATYPAAPRYDSAPAASRPDGSTLRLPPGYPGAQPVQ